jgi:DNA-binding MurR/RpiR family transcriptional regulator
MNDLHDLDQKSITWDETKELIQARYPKLSKRLQQVAAYVLENPSVVAFETIAVISDHIKVPPSTLIRFASALDFDGFNELKSVIKDDMLENTVNYSSRIQLIRDKNSWDSDELLSRFARANRDALINLEQTTSKEDIRSAVELLNKARHIFLLGNGRAHTVATYLYYTLNHIDKKVFLINGAGNMFNEQMSNVERGDLLFAISYSPYSSNTCDLAAKAANRGVTVLSITDSPVSPLANTSQLSFVIHEARVDAFRSLSGSLLLAQILAITLADCRSSAKDGQ